MRLIDADKLQQFPIRANRCDKEHANKHFLNGGETVLEYAEQLPTVDAEVVVRCKERKWTGGDLWYSIIRRTSAPMESGGEVTAMNDECKWMQDEVCVNADCPACADFCPVANTPGVCKYEERGNSDAQTGKRQTGAK